ncbi:MAG: hypothetical protein IPK84_00405 [Candidatus Moraniibacteriota bacterium]|nr:MAG: hypothetical protein IPK84_00405 [Candidatus Moranbacteria bacterium]
MNELDQSVSKENEIKKTPASLAVFVVAELLSLAAIIAVGWFLIGYYTQAEFLQTGYPDWMYHAFRIRDIQQYGIASWDHIWNNGLNHWRAYQYVQHYLVYGVVLLSGWSITHAMLWVTVIAFILLRILIYGVLRIFGVNRLLSVFVAIISYDFAQQYIAIMDFSMFLGFMLIPLYILLWVWTFRDRDTRFLYVLTAITGASWSVHPIAGLSFFGLLVLLILAKNIKQSISRLIIVGSIFLVSSAPFLAQYVFAGYSISNPFLASPQFLRDTVFPDYFGLSLLYFILLGVCWCVFLVASDRIPQWAKVLLFYCTAYLVFIYFGQLGYYPSFINKFQFSRAVTLIGMILPFCFGVFLYVGLSSARSRLAATAIIAVMSVSIVNSIDIGSYRSGWPTASISDPVAIYFADKDIPQGSIYFKNFVDSEYVGKPGLRFVNSYNQHLMPNPYPMRFDILMKTDIAYTGATDRQIDLIDDYSTVLGVEYVFVPKLSPLVLGLTTDRGSIQASFEQVGEVELSSEVFSVLRNRRPIANAYVFESDRTGEILRFSDIAKPTLNATSYEPWDEEVHRMAELIRSGDLKPITLSFGWPDRLEVDGSSFDSFQHPAVLINQSYDVGWRVENADNVRIEPTDLRFMYLSDPSGGSLPRTIQLKNSWPWWHWPVQTLGVLSIAITLVAFVISSIWRRNRSVS